MKFNENPRVGGALLHEDRRTDAFGNFANAPTDGKQPITRYDWADGFTQVRAAKFQKTVSK